MKVWQLRFVFTVSLACDFVTFASHSPGKSFLDPPSEYQAFILQHWYHQNYWAGALHRKLLILTCRAVCKFTTHVAVRQIPLITHTVFRLLLLLLLLLIAVTAVVIVVDDSDCQWASPQCNTGSVMITAGVLHRKFLAVTCRAIFLIFQLLLELDTSDRWLVGWLFKRWATYKHYLLI